MEVHGCQSSTTQVFVQEKRRKSLLWVGAASALAIAAGGGTFALWSASDAFGGGTITAGDLNVEAAEDQHYYDISDDRSDAMCLFQAGEGEPSAECPEDPAENTLASLALKGHQIDDAGTWNMVPGDEVLVMLTANVTMKGDNLLAALNIDGMDSATSAINVCAEEAESSGDGYDEGDLIQAECSGDGDLVIATIEPIAFLLGDTNGEDPAVKLITFDADDALPLHLAAPRAGQEEGGSVADRAAGALLLCNATPGESDPECDLSITSEGKLPVQILLKATFSSELTERNGVGFSLDLEGLFEDAKVTLNQVRVFPAPESEEE